MNDSYGVPSIFRLYRAVMSTLPQREGASASEQMVGAVRERIRETRRLAAEAQLRYQKGAEDLMAGAYTRPLFSST